jgi:hypothetical protein
MLNLNHISKITDAFGGKMPSSVSEKLSSLMSTKK